MYVYKLTESKKKKWDTIGLFFTFLVAAGGSYFVQSYVGQIFGAPLQNENNTVLYSEGNNSDSKSFVNNDNILENAMKSVVGISKLQANEESIFDINFTEKWGFGTGIIVSKNGYILTNQHLAGKVGSKLIVNLENGESVQGKVMWVQQDIDLAIVKINKNNLEVAKLGNSDNIKIGNEVWAIGNPLGVEFQRTTTKGIISGVNRTLTFKENGKTIFMEDLIQTDASINNGNSGGPLINQSGEVIGINTVKIDEAVGLGFAVPINIVKPIIESFVEKNSFIEVNLGIYAYDKEIIKYVNSKIKFDSGIYVTSVTKNSAADKAGIKAGNIIISIDGNVINKMTDLRKYIYTKNVGDSIRLLINKNNKIESVSVKL